MGPAMNMKESDIKHYLIGNGGAKVKFIEKRGTLLNLALIVLTLAVFQGCGSKHDTAPSGSSITITPSDLSLSNIYLYGDVKQDYVVTLKYSDGTPIPDTALTVKGSYASPVTSTTGSYKVPRYQFWHYSNANANADNVAENSGFTAITDKSGNYTFSIQIYSTVTLTTNGTPVNNAFTDNITVTSGAASGSTKVTVN